MSDQRLLNLISSTFSSTLSSPRLPEHLQSLKRHLYNRSFAEAFPTSTFTAEDETQAKDQEAMLEAYVVRWVPTRVLCYSRIFERIARYLGNSSLKILCVGAGCGSESLALQASLSRERIVLTRWF
jgi:25S rRNA (uracil2843-N3)-methyltransferase